MVDKTKSGSAPKLSKKKDSMQHPLAKPEVSDLIGERLRSFYDDVAKQPVPDRFLDLLNQLQAASSPEKKT
jgi:Anti-sigma factor NepR